MMQNQYAFTTHWRVESTREEVFEILSDAEDLVRWWPSVYLAVEELEPGDETGLGKVISLYTKGWLPYTLRWQFRVSAVDKPRGFSLEAWGDFVGRGDWTFRQDGSRVDITYVWVISAEKPLLRYLSFLMKPLFSANHHWAMRQGEISLARELARRHARTPSEQAAVLPPPPPTFRFLLRS